MGPSEIGNRILSTNETLIRLGSRTVIGANFRMSDVEYENEIGLYHSFEPLDSDEVTDDD